jgi:hypothetical protein
MFEYINTWEHGLALVEADAAKLRLSLYLDATGRLGDDVVLLRPANR